MNRLEAIKARLEQAAPLMHEMPIEPIWLCPYNLGTGTCTSGCRDEPSCQTDDPGHNWALDRLLYHAPADLALLVRAVGSVDLDALAELVRNVEAEEL